MSNTILSRATWGAKHREGFGSRSSPVSSVFAHHSMTKAPPRNATLAQDIAAMRQLEDIGQSRFGGGTSYPYAIFPSGRIFRGLGDNRIGAHTKGYNTTGTAFVLVGNYESGDITPEQRAAAVWLLADLRRRGVITVTAKLRPHSDVSATACPGRNVRNQLFAIDAESRTAPKEAPVDDRRFLVVTITDLGDPTHRAAILRLIGTRYRKAETANHIGIHVEQGEKADVFLEYAAKHELSCSSITVTADTAHTTLIRRSEGKRPVSDNASLIAVLGAIDDMLAAMRELIAKAGVK